jgi:hypothetical protein
MPGGFHPFHAGHMALYQSAIKAFPGADVYVAASNDTSERPFPFKVKEKLAKVSGVPAGHFVQVKSPFRPSEITDQYNPDEDVLVFVRSEKDRNEEPKPGGKKKDGSLAYFQPYTGKNLKPFSQHAYMAYLPTVEFGPGITSATEIRNAWPKLNEKRKLAMVMSLYPATQKNEKLGKNVVAMLDSVMGGQQGVAEEVNPDVTSDEYFIEPTENVRIGDFVFNARTFTGALGDFNSKGLQIRAYDPKNLKSSIGSADFIVKKDKKGNTWLESDDTEVDDEYRGKGVATMMYAFAKSLGNDIKPSPYQSNAGGTMWKKWGSDAKHLGEQGVAESELNRFKKYVRPVVKTTPKIERTTNPAGRTTDHVEWKVTSPTGEIHRYNSKKQAQAHFDSFSKQGVAEGLLEAREGAMREVIRNALPSWPDYVIKDWISSRIKNEEDLKNLIGWMGELNKMVEPNSWKLHQKMFLTFDMLNPKTRYFMKTKRQFGARNPFLIPRDEERSANAEQLVKTNGMENLPPVIMLQHNNGLELCEGWHRTMAAFRLHPEGFYVNAWIGQAGEQGVAEGWKDLAVGGAMALGALGAGAQTMPDINVKQVELANKYYNVLIQRAKEDGRELDTRTLNVLKAKAQDAAAKKTQQSSQQQGFPSPGSERKVAKDAGQFESQGMAENFADGRGPGRPGDSQRHGIRKGATMAELEKASHAAGRKGQLARWQLNMRRGQRRAH